MVEVKDVFFSYTGLPPYVLSGLNIDVPEGEYLSIVGENGSGKSTLIRLMLNFIKPTSGTVTSSSKRVGYVPQKNDFFNSAFPITVYEMLNSYRKLLKVKDRNAVNKTLERVGMTDFKNALAGTLSGGQYQKILIARALLGEPDLLILDEPSSGVDANSQDELYRFISKINRENGITVVSVEHNLDAAVSNSTTIYHLVNGQGHICTPRQYSEEFLKGRRLSGGGSKNSEYS